MPTPKSNFPGGQISVSIESFKELFYARPFHEVPLTSEFQEAVSQNVS